MSQLIHIPAAWLTAYGHGESCTDKGLVFPVLSIESMRGGSVTMARVDVSSICGWHSKGWVVHVHVEAHGCTLFDAPNLDAMSCTELFDFCTEAHDKARKTSSSDVRDALLALAHYADVKRQAMRLRLDGQIANAMKLETRCERIYDRMPQFIRW